MITIAIVTRRLKEGKTYEDFRKAWFHTVGFGTPSKLYTMINAADPREIIVIGFVETELDQFMAGLDIDVKERLDHSLDDVIEPAIGRKFGIMVSEDDFSAAGSIEYKPASIAGKETDLKKVSHDLSEIVDMIAKASLKRDRARQTRSPPKNNS
jgi:predicted NBD/HSP70 family sugar kinase